MSRGSGDAPIGPRKPDIKAGTFINREGRPINPPPRNQCTAAAIYPCSREPLMGIKEKQLKWETQ